MPRWRAVGAFMVSLGSRRGIGGKGDGLGVFKYHRALIYTSRSAPSCRNAPNWDRASCQVLPSLLFFPTLTHHHPDSIALPRPGASTPRPIDSVLIMSHPLPRCAPARPASSRAHLLDLHRLHRPPCPPPARPPGVRIILATICKDPGAGGIGAQIAFNASPSDRILATDS